MDKQQNIPVSVSASIARQQGRLFVFTFLACIFAYPLSSYITEFLGIQSNFLSIMARACTLALVLWYFGFLLLHNLFRPVPIFYVFLLFWLLYIVRIFHDTLQHGWMLGRPPSDYYLFALVLSFFCSFPFFVPVAIPFKFMERMAWVILVLLNALGAGNIFSTEVLFLERVGGNEKLNPIMFGMLGAMLAVLSLIRLLRPGNSLVMKGLNIATILLGFFTLVAAASKSPILYFFTTFFCLMYYQLKMGNKKSLFLLLGVMGAAVSAVFIYGLQDMLLLLITRFTDITSDNSSLERWDMLSGGFKQFLQQPIMGSFLEERISKEYPHNLVIEAFMATGIVGGTIFLVFYLAAIRATFRVLFSSGFSFVALMVLAYNVVSMFSGGLSFSTEFWFCNAATFALAYHINRQNKSLSAAQSPLFAGPSFGVA